MPHELDVVSYREGYGRGFDEALRLVERYGYVLNAPRMVINGAGYDGWHPEDEFPKKITITEQQLDIENMRLCNLWWIASGKSIATCISVAITTKGASK